MTIPTEPLENMAELMASMKSIMASTAGIMASTEAVMASTAAKYIALLSSKGSLYQYRDEFTTAAAAPMGSHPFTRTTEPGPGTAYMSQGNSTVLWRIVDGILEVAATSPAESSAAISTVASFDRVAGLAFKARVAQNPNGTHANAAISPILGWNSANTRVVASTTMEGLFYGTIGSFSPVERTGSSTPFYSALYTANTYQTFTFILRGTGCFMFADNTLVYASAASNATPVYPNISQFIADRHTPKVDYMRVGQLGGLWADDFGFATNRLAGARSASDAFAHEANSFMVEFVPTTLPSAGSITVDVRRQDANNYWRIALSNTGALTLVEVVAGSPTTRVTLNGCAANDRIQCYMQGAVAHIARYRASDTTNAVTAYGSVATFTTQTSGVISSLGTGGAISDLVSWPGTLSGTALALVNAL